MYMLVIPYIHIICYCFSLQLNDKISITNVSIEHIPKELSPNGSLVSAPQNFTVLVSIRSLLGFYFGVYRAL